MQSNIELAQLLVSLESPSFLPFLKIRDNPNVTKEEWDIILSVGSSLNKFNYIYDTKFTNNNINFLKKLLITIETLLSNLGKILFEI